jgi:hypothetical protein
MSPAIEADAKLIACCGLYCAACGAHRKGRCPGCAGNTKASWCKVRACCAEKKIATCAECVEHPDPRECRKFHNPISRIIGFILRSDRRACIFRIRQLGPDAYSREMAQKGTHAIRR